MDDSGVRVLFMVYDLLSVTYLHLKGARLSILTDLICQR